MTLSGFMRCVVGCRLLRHDESGEDVSDHTREKAGEDDHQKPEKAQEHRVDVEVFPQPSANAGEDLVRIASIKLFVCHNGILSFLFLLRD